MYFLSLQLEKWWEDVGYLESRQPLAILGNFSGVCPFIFSPWPPAPGTQVERMALVAWYSLKYWQLIRRQVSRSGDYTCTNKNLRLGLRFLLLRQDSQQSVPVLLLKKCSIEISILPFQ